MSLLRVILLNLVVQTCLCFECKPFMRVQAGVQVGRDIHVFHQDSVSTVNSFGSNANFPRLSQDSVKQASSVWPSSRVPVLGIYKKKETINLIANKGDTFYVYEYKTSKEFSRIKKLSDDFPFLETTTSLKVLEMYSVLSYQANTMAVFHFKLKVCTGGWCKDTMRRNWAIMSSGAYYMAVDIVDSERIPGAVLSLDWKKHGPVPLLAFYGPFFVFLPMSGFLYQYVRSVHKKDYHLSTHWLGCPQVFCFEGETDAAVRFPDSNKYVIFREFHYWTFEKWPLSGDSSPIKQKWPTIVSHVDAAFADVAGDKVYLFKGEHVFINTGGVVTKKTISDLFPGLERDIDAAFATKTEIYLFKEYWFWVYNITGALKERSVKVTEMKQLPKSLDAALAAESGTYYFFKGNFFYQFDDNLLITRGPFLFSLSHDLHFRCPDAFYTTNPDLALYLSIKTFDSFRAHVKKSPPVACTEAEIPVTTPSKPRSSQTTSNSTNSTGTEPTTKVAGKQTSTSSAIDHIVKKKPMLGFVLVGMALLLILLVAAAVGFFIFSYRRKRVKGGEGGKAMARQVSMSNISISESQTRSKSKSRTSLSGSKINSAGTKKVAATRGNRRAVSQFQGKK